MSPGTPSRGDRTEASISLRHFSVVALRAAPVRITPGARELQRTPCLPPREAEGSDLVDHGISGRLIQIRGHDGRALLGKADGGRPADVAWGCAGNDGNFALESSHGSWSASSPPQSVSVSSPSSLPSCSSSCSQSGSCPGTAPHCWPTLYAAPLSTAGAPQRCFRTSTLHVTGVWLPSSSV